MAPPIWRPRGGVVSSNLIRNPNITGGSAGTPPTNWSAFGAGTGLTVTWVGGGIDPILNVSYFDVQLSGTASTGSAFGILVENAAPISQLALYTYSFWASFSAGSLTGFPNSPNLEQDQSTSGGAYLTTTGGAGIALTSTPQRYTSSITSVATAGLTNCYFAINYNTGVALNCTFRLSLPRLDQGTGVQGDAFSVRGIRLPGAGTTKAIRPFPIRDSGGVSSNQTLFPGVGSLVLTGLAPSVDEALSPGVGSLVFTGQAPSADESFFPGAGSIVFNGQAPSVALGITVAPGVGSVVLTGQSPSVNESLLPSAGSIVINGQTPSVNETVAPSAGSIVFNGFAPSVTVGTTVAPSAGSIIFTGQAPTVDETVLPGAGSIVFTGQVPGVSNPAPGQNLLPSFGSIVFTGQAPSLDVALSPGVGSIVFTGLAPSLDIALFPDVGSVLFDGFGPVVTGQGKGTSQGGDGGGIWDAAEQRRRWLAWRAGRKKPEVSAPLTSAPIRPVPAVVIEPETPAPSAQVDISGALLQANLEAMRAQRESITANTKSLASALINERTRLKKVQDDDDDDAISILFDD